jgi:hypothetical protein
MSFLKELRGTAAELAHDNPLLDEDQYGYETDTFITKRGNGRDRYRNLPISILPPGGVLGMLSSTVVATNVLTKQALYTVQTGYKCVIDHIVSRGAQANISTLNNLVGVGFNAACNDWGVLAIDGLIGPTLVQITPTIDFSAPASATFIIGNAGDVFGFKTSDVHIVTTFTIDVFGYLIKV